jgi:hypothetical protein
MRSRSLFPSAAVLLLALAWAAPAQEARKRLVPTSQPQAEYFAVFADGKKIGRMKQTRLVVRNNVITKVTMQVTMTRSELPITIGMETTFTETVDAKPVSFRLMVDAAAMPMLIEGTVGKGNKLVATRTIAQMKQTETVDWPEGALMQEAERLLAMKMGLKEGTRYAYKRFDPLSLSGVETKVQIGPTKSVDLLGRVARLVEVKTASTEPSLIGPVETEVVRYLDKDFRELKSVAPVLGTKMEFVACSKEFALSKDEVVDFLDKVILTSPAPLSGVASVRSITYQLTPTGGRKIVVPATDSQTVRPGKGGTSLVTVRPAAAGGGVKFPYKGKDEAALEAMKPTRFLQSGQKKVVALARQAVGDATDAAEAVRRIEGFVRKYVSKKDLSVGYASAVEVAESRQGDCSEHAVLAAAMCRAVGIPARVVMGLVYAERFGQRRHIFGPHAWVQAYLGGKWVGLDATTEGFDAGHIALAVGNGDPESFFQLLGNLGQFTITKVDVEK